MPILVNIVLKGLKVLGENNATILNNTAVIFGLCHNWTSLIAQFIKNLSAMQETPVQFLGQEDPLEKEMAMHSSILAWEIP